MKVMLVDSRPGSDFTLDAVWAGLVQLLGADRVVDWPPKDKHRADVPKQTGDKSKDYGNERQSICYTRDYVNKPRLFLEQVNALLRAGEIEFIVIDERTESYRWYAQTIAPHIGTPVVVVAGHDRIWEPIEQLPIRYRNLKAVFVDNWQPEFDTYPNVYPMNYATNFDHLWDPALGQVWKSEPKTHDICFMGYNSHPDRKLFVDHLAKKYGRENNLLLLEEMPNTVEAFKPKSRYFEEIARSRVCINLRGAAVSGKALRFYEIPYVGSYMLSQRFGGRQLYPFLEGVHCGYFSDVDELDQKIEWALAHPEEREKIAFEGHLHALNYHTASGRVLYMFEKMEVFAFGKIAGAQ